RQYRKEDGLASDFVLSLFEDSDGALWIGTGGGGLSRLKENRFSNIGPLQGLPPKVIAHIEGDQFGAIWMSTEGGILRVNKTALQRCADGQTNRVQCTVFGRGDGLETTDCPSGFQPAGCTTPDGHLWFPTRKGLVTVEPANLRTNSLPPPVYVEAVLV